MAPRVMGGLPSMLKQHLQSEFAGLKQACPEGLFLSLTPGDPTLWSGVLFVRDGPYSSSVLRFHVSFPDAYPRLPPLVTFATDMFHPLITPLTTYMYTTDIQENGTVSATDDERLPPGGFSLRHGFPEWFGRGKRQGSDGGGNSAGTEGRAPQTAEGGNAAATPRHAPPRIMKPLPDTPESGGGRFSNGNAGGLGSAREISIYDVLKYIRSAFDSEETMDAIPLAAAGNPGAWHAWRSHQRKLGKLRDEELPPVPAPAPAPLPLSDADIVTQQQQEDSIDRSSQNTGKRPGEWNWAGVWEDRVKKNIATSLSEPVLYGGASTGPHDELIRFLPLERGEIDSIKENIRRTLGPTVCEPMQ